mmetsp:Transcript_12722/g.32429  ORF Transcript_12722/g.32429 Transcript_12722/m.32429 type:complete len:716 (+) Transcript_12722:970-3117(+)
MDASADHLEQGEQYDGQAQTVEDHLVPREEPNGDELQQTASPKSAPANASSRLVDCASPVASDSLHSVRDHSAASHTTDEHAGTSTVDYSLATVSGSALGDSALALREMSQSASDSDSDVEEGLLRTHSDSSLTSSKHRELHQATSPEKAGSRVQTLSVSPTARAKEPDTVSAPAVLKPGSLDVDSAEESAGDGAGDVDQRPDDSSDEEEKPSHSETSETDDDLMLQLASVKEKVDSLLTMPIETPREEDTPRQPTPKQPLKATSVGRNSQGAAPRRAGPPAIPSLSMEEVQRKKEEEGAQRAADGATLASGGGIEALLSSRKSRIAVEMEREWMQAMNKELMTEANEDEQEEALFRDEVNQLWDEMVDVLRKTWVPSNKPKESTEALEEDYSELIGDLLDFGLPEDGGESTGTPRSARLARAISSKFTRIGRTLTPRSGLVTADSSPRRLRDKTTISNSPRAVPPLKEPIDKPVTASALTGEQLFEWEGYVTLMREKFYQDMDLRWQQRLAEKQEERRRLTAETFQTLFENKWDEKLAEVREEFLETPQSASGESKTARRKRMGTLNLGGWFRRDRAESPSSPRSAKKKNSLSKGSSTARTAKREAASVPNLSSRSARPQSAMHDTSPLTSLFKDGGGHGGSTRLVTTRSAPRPLVFKLKEKDLSSQEAWEKIMQLRSIVRDLRKDREEMIAAYNQEVQKHKELMMILDTASAK